MTSLGDLRVRPVANGQHHRIAIDRELRAFLRDRLAATRSVRRAEFHPDQFHPDHISLIIADEVCRRSEVVENHAFLTSMHALFSASLHLGFGAAVDKRHLRVGRKPLGGAHAVHRGIAAAYHDGMLAKMRTVAKPLGQVLEWKIASHQIFRCLIDILQLVALNPNLAIDGSAVSEEDRIVAMLVEQIFYSEASSHLHVANELDSNRFEMIDVIVDDVLFKLEVRDTVEQQTAGLRPRIVYHALVT